MCHLEEQCSGLSLSVFLLGIYLLDLVIMVYQGVVWLYLECVRLLEGLEGTVDVVNVINSNV